jgi:arylsulfatase A-like enzyme
MSLAACSGADSTAPVETEAAPAPRFEPKRHAIVILIDTLRADAVAKANTPVLDGLAAKGDSVPMAWSAGTWTVPSVIGLFTGMPVRQHGWDLPSGKIGKYPPFPPVPTLAEVMKQGGFATTGMYANTYLTPELGFERGFDSWRRVPDKAVPRELAKTVKKWKDTERHFLYLHIMGPHSPLRPSPEAAARWEFDPSWTEENGGMNIGVAKRGRKPGARAQYEKGYHAVVEDTDALLGEILQSLAPYADDAVIVVTSDHGEMLGTHNERFGHGTWAWQELTHVPLIAVGAGDLPQTMSITGIADLVTWSVGVKHTWPASRTDALPLVAQREGIIALSPDGVLKGIWKDDTLSVYDLEADPNELKLVSGQDKALTDARTAWEKRIPAGTTSLERVELADETKQALQALGYLQSDP